MKLSEIKKMCKDLLNGYSIYKVTADSENSLQYVGAPSEEDAIRVVLGIKQLEQLPEGWDLEEISLKEAFKVLAEELENYEEENSILIQVLENGANSEVFAVLDAFLEGKKLHAFFNYNPEEGTPIHHAKTSSCKGWARICWAQGLTIQGVDIYFPEN